MPSIPIANSSHPIVNILNTLSMPGIISGITTICSGSVNTYSISAVTGATFYTWTTPAGWSGTSTTNNVSTTASTTSGNVIVTANNTCGSSSPQTLAITVDSIPTTPTTITGPASVCFGISNPYNVSAISGATSYTWTLPSGWSGTSTTNTITAITDSTSGNITITASNSCGTSPVQTLAVTAHSLPHISAVTNDSLLCIGQSAILTASGANTYLWNTSETTNSISVTPPVGTTTYTVTGTDINGCSNSTTITQDVTVCAGITENSNSITSNIYPIPAKDVLNIELVNVSNQNTKITVNIYSIDGKKVFYSQYDNSDKIILNVSDIETGMYVVEVITDNGKLSKNIVITH